MRISGIRALVVALLAPTAIMSMAGAVTPTVARAVGEPHVLHAGESTSWFESASVEFWLNILASGIHEYQTATRRFEGTVWATPTLSSSVQPGKITMQSNGDLVLRNRAGHRIWHTNTAGTGHHNSFKLLDSGNLVVVTAAGKRVWASHSGRTLLVSGMQLQPGVGAA